MRQWTVPLPYSVPPLQGNQRHHHHKRARLVRKLRAEAGWAVRGARVPRLTRCRVELHYAPRDARRRDADNLWPTHKSVCDGVVDAGVVPDDTPQWMDKPTPILHPPEPGGQGRLWLVITDLGEAA